jgi:hypothetical protein
LKTNHLATLFLSLTFSSADRAAEPAAQKAADPSADQLVDPFGNNRTKRVAKFKNTFSITDFVMERL